MNILCLFAGQGFHHSNLFNMFRNNPQALELIKEFSQLISVDLLEDNLAVNNPYYSQLIIGAYQFILFRMLEPLLAVHSLDFAGYSLGEISAYLASTQAPTTTAYQVLSYRTQLMTSILSKKPVEHYDLLLVSGNFELEIMGLLCHRYRCFIAIVNTQHLVIGGTVTNLKKLQSKLPLVSKFLAINLPSHTPLYQDNMGLLQQFLASMQLNKLRYPLFSPIKLSKIYDCKEEESLLDQQLYSCLYWDKICNLINEYHYDLIIDLGPSAFVSSLLKLQNRDIALIITAQYKSIDGIMNRIKNYNTQ